MDQLTNKGSMRFLSFSNDKEEAEKQAKLNEAAKRVEEALARERALNDLIDYIPPEQRQHELDPSNDTRSLYERLQEQKEKKKEAVDESHKLSNMISKLDEEDATYLNDLAIQRQQEDIKNRLEIQNALGEKRQLEKKKQVDHEHELKKSLFTSAVLDRGSLRSNLASKIKVKPKSQDNKSPTKNDTTDIIMDATNEAGQAGKQTHTSPGDGGLCGSRKREDSGPKDEGLRKKQRLNLPGDRDDMNKDEDRDQKSKIQVSTFRSDKQVMRCIGLLPSLPIWSHFSDSSDSDASDDFSMASIVPKSSTGHHES